MRSEHKLARSRRRRTRAIGIVTVCAGVAAGIVVTTGVASGLPVSAPAAGSEPAVFRPAQTGPASSQLPTNTSFAAITTTAKAAIDEGRTALASVPAVQSDIAASGFDLGDTAVDTSGLEAALARFAGVDVTPLLLVPDRTAALTAETGAVTERVSALRGALDSARAQKAAADAAAEAQRQAEAAAAAAAAALAAANTPAGAQATARQMASDEYGWGSDQFSCLLSLWNRESSWNYQAYNSGSGATGIPQALPGSKMASAGSDWESNAATQIRWGLGYIAGSYGTPCSAWGHSQSTGWY